MEPLIALNIIPKLRAQLINTSEAAARTTVKGEAKRSSSQTLDGRRSEGSFFVAFWVSRYTYIRARYSCENRGGRYIKSIALNKRKRRTYRVRPALMKAAEVMRLLNNQELSETKNRDPYR